MSKSRIINTLYEASMNNVDLFTTSSIQNADSKMAIAEENLKIYITQNIKKCHREPLRKLFLNYEMAFSNYYDEIKEQFYHNGFTDCAEAVKVIFK